MKLVARTGHLDVVLWPSRLINVIVPRSEPLADDVQKCKEVRLWAANQLHDPNDRPQLCHHLLSQSQRAGWTVWWWERTASPDESVPVGDALQDSAGEWVHLGKL